MKDKLNQFILNLQGQFVEVSDASNRFQCMDLAYNWVFVLGYPKATIQHLYAYQVFTEPNDITRKYFDVIPNSPEFIPNDGDIAVYDKTPGNIAGHIGIALGGGTTASFKCFEQNYPVGTNSSVRDRNYTTPKLLGVLRPKVLMDASPDQTKLDELKAIVKAFTEFRHQLAEKLKCEDQTTSVLGAVERFITIEDDLRSMTSKYEEADKKARELEEDLESSDKAIAELESKIRGLQGLEKALNEANGELALLRERKVLDRHTTFELIRELVQRILRKK